MATAAVTARTIAARAARLVVRAGEGIRGGLLLCSYGVWGRGAGGSAVRAYSDAEPPHLGEQFAGERGDHGYHRVG